MKLILTLLILFALGGIFFPAIASAVECPPGSGKDNGLNLCYPSFPGALPLTSGIKIEQLVAWLYVFIVGISGLAAFVMIVWGGVQWMTSSGSATATSDAKEKIKMALLGLLLVLASFLILQIINPELTILRGLQLAPIPASMSGSASGGSQQGSSGSPIANQACIGPGSLLKSASQSTLDTIAKLICNNNNGNTPTDAVIHSTLVNMTGAGGCNQNDIDTIRENLQKTCGAPAGGTDGNIAINQGTVPAQFCSFTNTNNSASGMVFSNTVKGTTAIMFIASIHSPEDAAPLIKENTSAIMTFCGIPGNDNPFCFLLNAEKTRISTLSETQKNLLVQYCTDILPEKPKKP